MSQSRLPGNHGPVAAWILARPRRTLWLLLALQILAHIPFLHLPPVGQHGWRQVMGHSFAENFAREDMHPLYPRSRVRVAADDTGVIYPELPLVSWLIGATWKLKGSMEHTSARLVCLLFTGGLIFFTWHLARRLGYGTGVALLSAWFVAWSPYFVFYSVTPVPDLPAMTVFAAGLVLYLRAHQTGRFGGSFILGALLIGIAAACKPTWLFFGILLAGIPLHYYRRRPEHGLPWFPTLVAGVIILGLAGGSILHSNRLYDEADRFNRAMMTPGTVGLVASFEEFWRNFSRGATTWFLEMFVNMAAIPFFLAGVVAAWRRVGPARWFWSLWCLSFLVFACLFLSRFGDHDYYLTPVLLPAATASALGCRWLWLRGGWQRHLALVLLILVPVGGVIRVEGRWTRDVQVPAVLLQEPESLTQLLPPGERILVLGDPTPNVFLYYLNRYGVAPFGGVDAVLLEGLYQQGIRYAVARDEKADLRPLLGRATRLGHNRGLSVYRIHPRAGEPHAAP